MNHLLKESLSCYYFVDISMPPISANDLFVGVPSMFAPDDESVVDVDVRYMLFLLCPTSLGCKVSHYDTYCIFALPSVYKELGGVSMKLIVCALHSKVKILISA